jgi:MerR family glutamine synthetase transcriptional repressor
MPPQMLRRYEEAGLLEPARQGGKNRLYSDEDVSVLREVAELYEQGINAAGIRYIIQMRRQVTIVQRTVKDDRQRSD